METQESLLAIPLVRTMLEDPYTRFCRRSVERRWTDSKRLSAQMVGFNPFSGSLFLAADSKVWAFLENPAIRARLLNKQDHFIKDLLFTVHDYLHIWALRFLHSLFPKLGLCTQTIDSSTLEDFAFCHLLTEAAATVGLDYWYLSTIDLNDIVCLGTEFRAGLTTSYEERLIHEYRRGHRAFDVQNPRFFEDMARFYCSGVFHGFNLKDLDESPSLNRWVLHEISYGEQQRIAIRQWLSFLSDQGAPLNEGSARQAVSLEPAWRIQAIQELGAALWDLVKRDRQLDLPPLPSCSESWQTRRGAPLDPRFINFKQTDDEELLRYRDHPLLLANFDYVVWQLLSGLSYDLFDPEILKLIGFMREKKDLKLLLAVLRQCPRLEARDEAPRDLLMIN